MFYNFAARSRRSLPVAFRVNIYTGCHLPGLVLNIDQDALADMPRVRSMLEKYADLPAEFTDASLVALAERLQTRFVASVDKDFTIYRTCHNQRFTNLFFDA